MMAHLFDSLMKTMLLLIDGVLDDREGYAMGEKARALRRNNELEDLLLRRKENFEIKIEKIKQDHKLKVEKLEERIQAVVKEKEEMARLMGELNF